MRPRLGREETWKGAADMPKREAQTIEYKSSWQEDYFGWIAGYANASGGII